MSDNTQQPMDNIDLTETEQGLKIRVQTAMARLPRFLFRFYHSTSGGYEDLNTPTAITPLAFSHHNREPHPSSCFYKLTPDRIAFVANMHMGGDTSQPTLFSSWSQSLLEVLAMAHGGRGSHICILDTALLDDSFIVLHTEQMPSVLRRPEISTFSYELLAFGVIRGPAYQAVPCSAVLESLRNLPVHPTTIYALTATALHSLTSLFNRDLQLAAAAHFLSTFPRTHDPRDDLIQMLSSLPLPAEYGHDPKIMDLRVIIFRRDGDCEPSIEAAELIRDVVRLSLVARPPRELRNLHIDAIGWNQPVGRLRPGQ